MLHNKPFKKITVTGQTINKEYVLAVHNPKEIDYSGVYALKLKAAGKLFRVDFSIAGDNEISHSDVNIGILNIVDNNSGIGTTQTAFNNNFTLKVVQNAAGLNLIIIRMLTVIMSGDFEMTITNSVPTGLDWSDYGKYIGKDYSTIAGYPFANETVKSPVKILGGINAPEVTTTAATSVTSSGMILNASLTTLGSEASVNVAFDWRLVGAGSWTRTSLVAKTTIGTFSATLSGLSSNTTYEYRAVVIGQSNPGNDAIGGVLSQLTVAINIDADSGVNITGTSGGSALNTTNVPSVTNGAVNNATGLMTATADNCVSQTVEIAQQVGQSDFQLLRTTFALAPYQVAIDPASNTTTLVVTDPESGKFVNNSKFWLESAGVMKLVQAASVVETTYDNSAAAWTQQTIGTGNTIQDVIYAFGVWWTCAGGGYLAKSTDNGVTWNSVSNPFGSNSINAMAFDGTTLVLVGAQGNLATSTDGASFTSRTSSFGTTSILGVAYGGGKFVACGASGKLAISTDGGLNWSQQANPLGASNIIYDVVYSGSKWVLVATNNNIYTSVDAVTWAVSTSAVPFTGTTTIVAAAYGNGKFIAATTNAQIATSADGNNWALVYSGSNGIQDVAFVNGIFIAVGSSGFMITSLDAIAWDTRTSGFGTTQIFAIAGNGQMAVAGGVAKVATSTAGLAYKYTCTSLTSLFGGAITTTPTLVYKAGQSFESSITATSGTTSYTADTLYSVSRSGNILTLIFNQRSATGRYVRSKATVNKGDVISRYVIDLWN